MEYSKRKIIKARGDTALSRRKPLGPDNVRSKLLSLWVKANIEIVKIQIKVFQGIS